MTVTSLLRVPARTPLGRYRLKVSMIEPDGIEPAAGERIRLGIAGGDREGRYDLCAIPGVRRRDTESTVYEEGFERGTGGWSAARGMTAASDERSAHEGGASLLVAGTQRRGWNYAAFRVPSALVGGGVYRLSAWMLVEKIEPKGSAPYVKIGVNGTDGRWLANYNSGRYDLAGLGTWQRLEAVADVPVDAGTADLAIEKGAHDTPTAAMIRLDEVKLELTESP